MKKAKKPKKKAKKGASPATPPPGHYDDPEEPFDVGFCRKCRAHYLNWKYNASDDVLDITCRNCGYEWTVPTYDSTEHLVVTIEPKPPAQAKKQQKGQRP